MTRTVDFHFDFGSPNAYLAHKVLPGIAERHDATVTYVPVLLGGVFRATGNRSPAEAFAGIKNRLEYEAIERDRFIRRHGLNRFSWNPHFPVNTLRLMRGAVAARHRDVFAPYVDTVFTAMWEDQVNMGDPEAARATLSAAGLDADTLMQDAESQPIKDELLDLTTRAVEQGDFGSPTFHIEGEIYFGKDRLRDVEDHLARL
ncbi:2-hydroxychromene-2-carboxylate isomerase [Pseudooceanicola onchidii]|uniref:2-hydroxychromene-2-carboxylate isomerase n=1 Tax=Pseudooceanicola onchidii TaxID=2562279 RepID=UPI0010AA6F17|nr:2-hydroxychromene-2-carboxylate isomerase [Pseudooceanicola onchidii]